MCSAGSSELEEWSAGVIKQTPLLNLSPHLKCQFLRVFREIYDRMRDIESSLCAARYSRPKIFVVKNKISLTVRVLKTPPNAPLGSNGGRLITS